MNSTGGVHSNDMDHSKRLMIVEKNMEVVEDRLEGSITRISDAVHEISVCVQQLVALQERHEVRYGETKSALERAFGEIKDHEIRIRSVETSSASSSTENKSTSDWVKLIIAMVLSSVATLIVTHYSK